MNPFINKDRVIVANCDLANIIGLNKAIVLNQINYWLEKSSHVIDGRKWVYNSFEAWHKQFSYWSLNTVKRTFKSLEEDGLIISGSYNKASFDKTKWYSIDYDKVFKLMQSLTHDDTVADSNWDNEESQNGTDNTIDYTKTTSKSTSFSLTLVDSAESTSVTEDKKPVPEEISDAEKEQQLGHLSGHCPLEIDIDIEKELNIETEKEKNINVDSEESTSEKQDEKAEKDDELSKRIEHFNLIYAEYPKKVGKSKAFDYYTQWLKGRKMSTGKIKLANIQMFRAVRKYVREQDDKKTDLKFFKDFDTFMNKAILDYIEPLMEGDTP